MRKAVLGLGTNLGKREENIRAAIRAIELLPDTTVISKSNLYETKPFDVTTEQGDYLNCCICILTEFSPKVLLGACLGVEAAMGRERREWHGERVIDIDLLLYEGETSSDKELTLPHSQILKRAFVLVPLSDIFPNKNALGLDFSSALERVDSTEVTRI
jgi:2-amino-4-hydroxy-6-hydroxymethyldihydropteridine diphosphokinase